MKKKKKKWIEELEEHLWSLAAVLLALLVIHGGQDKVETATMTFEMGYKEYLDGLNKDLITMDMLGDSMEPTLFQSNIGYAEIVDDATELNIGDIVVYFDKDSNIGRTIHRIVDIQNDTYILRGDNPITWNKIDKIKREKIVLKLVGVS